MGGAGWGKGPQAVGRLAPYPIGIGGVIRGVVSWGEGLWEVVPALPDWAVHWPQWVS